MFNRSPPPVVSNSKMSNETSSDSTQPNKLVDLGAAATFDGTKVSVTSETSTTSKKQDLDDIFGDFATPTLPTQQIAGQTGNHIHLMGVVYIIR